MTKPKGKPDARKAIVRAKREGKRRPRRPGRKRPCLGCGVPTRSESGLCRPCWAADYAKGRNAHMDEANEAGAASITPVEYERIIDEWGKW